MIEDDLAEHVERTYARYQRSGRARKKWRARNPGNRMIREELAALAAERAATALEASAPVLDVGCGTGWWLRQLADTGVRPERLNGIELLETRVDAARRAVPGADIRRGDARALPYAPDSFGLITAFTVVSSLPTADDARRALREMWRTLAPGGTLLVYEPRVSTPLNRNTIHVRAALLRQAPGRLETCSLTVLPPLARRLGRLAPRLYPRLARVPALRTHRLAALTKPMS